MGVISACLKTGLGGLRIYPIPHSGSHLNSALAERLIVSGQGGIYSNTPTYTGSIHERGCVGGCVGLRESIKLQFLLSGLSQTEAGCTQGGVSMAVQSAVFGYCWVMKLKPLAKRMRAITEPVM